MKSKFNNFFPLIVEDLIYHKSEKTLLSISNCKISQMGITVIVGPNGAGKTLFLKCLHGILECNFSKILFGSMPINNRIRFTQSMVFQTPILMRRSVLNNLFFVINQRKLKYKKKDVLKLLKKVDLLNLADEQTTFLSGGEKQRLCLARAIITKPKILFLDEATSNLDPYSIEIIEKIIKEVNLNGTKVIAVTHDLNQARRLANDIIFINNGKIFEHSKAGKFFKNPNSKQGTLFIKGKLIL